MKGGALCAPATVRACLRVCGDLADVSQPREEFQLLKDRRSHVCNETEVNNLEHVRKLAAALKRTLVGDGVREFV